MSLCFNRLTKFQSWCEYIGNFIFKTEVADFRTSSKALSKGRNSLLFFTIIKGLFNVESQLSLGRKTSTMHAVSTYMPMQKKTDLYHLSISEMWMKF